MPLRMKLLDFYSVVTCQEYYFISATDLLQHEHGQIFIIITHKSAALSNLFPRLLLLFYALPEGIIIF